MESLLINAWLNLHTEYGTRVDLPNIVITEQGNMSQNYGIKAPGICQITKLKRFYNKGLTIYLHSDFAQHNPTDQSQLMHEPAYYIQRHNERETSDCKGLLEVEAYKLQDDWRMLHNISQDKDRFKPILLESACNA